MEFEERGTVDKFYVCKLCPYRSRKKIIMNNHLKMHQKIKVETSTCDWNTSILLYPVEKMGYEDRGNVFRFQACSQCSYRSKSKTTIIEHLKLHHAIKTEEFTCEENTLKCYKCDQCPFKTSVKVSLHNHIRVFHVKEETYDLRQILENYKCENCDFQTFSLLQFYKHDINCQQGWPKYEHCVDILEYESDLKERIVETDSQESNLKLCKMKKKRLNRHINWFNCHKCRYRTRHPTILKLHMQMHLKSAKWFKCEQCTFKTKYKTCLQSHVKINHIQNSEVEERGTVSKFFVCKFCPYRSRTKIMMNNHLKRHQMIKVEASICDSNTPILLHPIDKIGHEERGTIFKYSACTLCPYRSKSKTTITEHFKLHHSIKTEEFTCEDNTLKWYKCDRCPFETSMKVSLHNHIKVFHEDKVTNDLKQVLENYKCENCNFHTFSLLQFWKHDINCQQDWLKSVYESEYTLEKNSQETNLKCHVKMNHIQNLEFEEKGTLFKFYYCKRCPYRTKSKATIIEHSTKLETFICLNTLKLYKCDQCDFDTPMKVCLQNHVRVFHEKKETKFDFSQILRNYSCAKCEFRTFSSLMLATHEDRCKFSRFGCFKCEHCSFKTKWKFCLKRHSFLHHRPIVNEVFKCEHCEFETKWKGSLKMHNISSHCPMEQLKWFDCNQCDFKTTWKYYIKKHMILAHYPDRTNWFECGLCDFKTKWKYYLKKHNLSKHGPHEGRWLQCGQCVFKTKSNSIFEEHGLKQHGSIVERFKCDQCTFAATCPSLLKEHFNVNHAVGADLIWYKCEHCPFQTKRKYYFKCHVDAQHNNKRFACEQCPFVSKCKANLKSHVTKIHAPGNVKWLLCERCTFKTRFKSSLEKHAIKVHTCEYKSFKCELCDFGSNLKRHLNIHMARRHPNSTVK